jgi:hypothetical protein
MKRAKFGKRELLVAVFLFAMTLSNVVSAVRLFPLLCDGYQDFTIFYAAACMVRSGQSHALYDLSAQYQAQQKFVPNVRIRQAALPYNHPPFEALLFVPFTFLPYSSAYLLWNLLNGILIFASLILLLRQFVEIKNLPIALLVLAATGFPPVVLTIIQGQDSILLLFLFVIALTAAEKEHDAAAGTALAAGLFKFHLVLPVIFLLSIRRWRLLLGFAPIAMLLSGISLAMVGWHGALAYVQLLLRVENTGASGAIAGDMPNLRGIIASLTSANMSPNSGLSLMLLTIICSAAAILIVSWRMGLIRDSIRFAFILATVTAILVSYHTLAHDLSLLLPVALLLFAAPEQESNRQSQTGAILLVLLYLVLFCEPFWPHVSQFCWPVLVLSWLFWKLSRYRTAGTVA